MVVRKRKKTARKKRRAPKIRGDVERYNERLEKRVRKTTDPRAPGREPSPVRRVSEGAVRSRYEKFVEEDRRPEPEVMKKYAKIPKMISKKVGYKRAMQILCDTIAAQGRRPPVLNTTLRDAASAFVIAMYAEIAKWDLKTLGEFVRETTGETPRYTDAPSLTGDAKRIFHEMFMDQAPDTEVVLRYDSVWKMWPRVVRKEDKMSAEPGSKRATKKKTGKVSQERLAAAKKKRAAAKKKKKTSKKSAPPWGASSKKTSKKAASKSASAVKITRGTRLIVNKESGEPKMEERQKIKKIAARSRKGIVAADLMEKAECALSTLQSMTRLGFFKVVG